MVKSFAGDYLLADELCRLSIAISSLVDPSDRIFIVHDAKI